MSPELHYVFDGALIGAALVCIRSSSHAAPILRSVWPYLIVVLLYVVWGLFVSPTPSGVMNAGLTIVVLSLLIVLGTAACIDSRRSLVSFANATQRLAIAAVAFMLYEIYDPTLIPKIALALNPAATAFNVTRPAALWANPDIAGPTLLFCFIMSLFATGWQAWLGRAAAPVGILLTTSRGAVYPLLAVIAVLAVTRLWERIRPQRSRTRRSLVPLVVSLALAAAGAFLALNIATSGAVQGFAATDLTKLLDPTGATTSAFYPSRSSLASYWLNAALSGPWQGSGLLSFHDLIGNAGAHDTYIMLLGETGAVVLLSYAVALAWLLTVIMRRTTGRDRVALVLLWTTYVFQGLVSHNQLDSVVAIAGAAVLFRASSVLGWYRSESAARALPDRSDKGSQNRRRMRRRHAF
jgi:hypothetical protein